MIEKPRKYFAKFSKALASTCMIFSGSSYSLAAFSQVVKAVGDNITPEETTRIMVSTENSDIVADKAIGQYENVYLLEYDSKEEAQKAYDKFAKNDSVSVDFDYNFELADGKEVSSSKSNEAEINPINELNDALKTEEDVSNIKEPVVAVIDTKVTEDSTNIIGNVSMLGEDTNGTNQHGNKMVSKILETNPNAKILAIEAISDNGTGTLSSVYSAIEYAIAQKVNVINLSIAAKDAENDEIFKEVIQKAVDAGITVVGAAGNNASDVKDFVPGNVDSAVIVNSCDEDGKKLADSNYGSTVDYSIKSETTSYAAAIASGLISKNGELIVDNKTVFSSDYSAEEEQIKSENKSENAKEEKENVAEDNAGNKLTLTEKNKTNTSEFAGDTKTNKEVVVKYLFVDPSKMAKGETIDDLWASEEAITSYSSETVPVYKNEKGNYEFLANTPYRNHYAIGDVLTYCFANANYNGEVIKDGVSFDSKTKIATVDSDALKKSGKEDFADLQLQIVVPIDVDGSVNIPYTVKEGSSSHTIQYKDGLTTRPFAQIPFQVVDADYTDKVKSIDIWVNGRKLKDKEWGYDSKTGYVTLTKRGVEIYSISVDVQEVGLLDKASSLFGVQAHDGIALSSKKIGQTGGVAGYIKRTDAIAKLTVGSTWLGTTNAWQLTGDTVTDGNNGFHTTGVHAGNFTNNFTATATDNAEIYYDGNGVAKMLYGIPYSMFGADTHIYSNVACTNEVPGVMIGGVYSNAGVMVACRHISASLGAGTTWMNNQVVTRVVDKARDANGYMHLVIAMETNGGGCGTDVPNMVQALGAVFELAYKDYEPGTFKIQKGSTDSLTKDNEFYSFKGTEYTVYKEKECANSLGVLTIGADGVSNTIELNKGTYFLKETKAGPGYALDGRTYSFVNNAGQLDVIDVYDEPITPPMILQKVSGDETITKNNPNYTFEGIEYTLYSDETCTKIVDVFKVDKDGNSNEVRALAGTYYLKETKTNSGYALDSKVYKVTNNFNRNVFKLKDTPNLGKFQIKKTSSKPEISDNNEKYYNLEGTEYTVYENSNATGVVGKFTINKDGSSNVLELKAGDYYIKETKNGQGFELDETIYKLHNDFNLNTLNVQDTPKLGKMKLIKKSSNESITENNKMYDLSGAEYTVYSDKEQKNVVGKLVTDKEGNSNVLELKAGTYYVKETKTAKNFKLDETLYTIENTLDLNVLNVKDEPETIHPDIPQLDIFKYDADTMKTTAQGDASLEGAEYQVNFYGDSFDSLEQLKESKATSLRSWVFRTDKDAKITLDEAHYVSGDELFKTSKGTIVVPYGTLDIVEIKAPKGYDKNDTHYLKKIQPLATSETKLTDIVKVGSIEIAKTATTGANSELVAMENGAEFGIVSKKYVDKYGTFEEAMKHTDEYGPKEFAVIKTDESGVARVDNLAYGNYIVKQTKVGVSTKEPDKELDICKDEITVVIAGKANEVHHLTFNNVSTRYGIKIVKQDSEANENITFSSAKFKIKDSKGNYIKQKVGNKYYDTFVTNSKGEISNIEGLVSKNSSGQYIDETDLLGMVTLPKQLESGKYTLEEVEAPIGYVLGKNQTFEINKNVACELDEDGMPIITIIYQNEKAYGELQIQKSINKTEGDTDLAKTSDLSEFRFKTYAKETIKSPIDGKILYNKGDLVSDDLTDKEGCIKVEKLPLGEYYIKEIEKTGYVSNDKIYNVDLTQKDSKAKLYKSVTDVVNYPTSVEFNKEDINSKGIVGAKLEVLDLSGKSIDSWTSNGNTHTILGLSVGKKYTLREAKAANGYVKAKDITFTVKDAKETQSVTMIDKIVDMSKIDVGGKEVEGAEIQVVNKEGNVVDKWTSGKEAHKIKGLEEGKTYTLQEVVTADGYVKATDIEFTVTGANSEGKKENQHIDMTDKIVDVVKNDVNGKAVKGATLQVIDKDGAVVDKWATDGKAHKVKGLVEGQTYTLQEVEPAESYVKAADIQFTVSGADKDGSKADQHITMIDKIVDMSKIDVGGKEVEGAEIQVIDKEGNVVDKWTSGKEAHKIKGLEEGKTYTLQEVVTADGYVKATDIEFTVTGANSEGKKENQHIDMTDKIVFFKKSDVNSGFVEGAKMSVRKLDGTVVDEWVSDSKKHKIKNLIEGESYILREDVAADGYVKALDIVFTVTGIKENQSISMVDKIVTNKKTTVSGDGLAGAELRVVDRDGNVVDKWTSNGKDHRIKGLVVGKSYVLEEIKAPAGFVKAVPIIFYVTEKAENQDFKLVDKKVTVSKTDVTGDNIEGAKLQVVDKEGNVIDKWTSGKGKHSVSGLTEGYVYTLQEAETAGGYVKAADIQFTASSTDKDGSKVDQHITMIDKIVDMSKIDVGGKEVEGAEIQVVDKEGNVVDKWTSGKETHKIKGLEEGKTYTLQEVVTADGYVKATDIEFTVTGANSEGKKENQHIDMTDKIVNIIKIDEDKKTISGAVIQVIDEENKVVDEWSTSGKAHNVNGLIAGHSYVIREKTAPNGYEKMKDVVLEVPDDKEDQKVNIIDRVFRVSKLDQNGNAVIGAKLQVSNEENIVDSWESGSKKVDVSDEIKSLVSKNKYAVWDTEEYKYKMEANYVQSTNIIQNIMNFIFGSKVEDYRLEVTNKGDGEISYYDVDIDGNETSHRVSNTIEGQEYTISEVETPETTENGVGYILADKQTALVSDKENTSIDVVDTKYDRVSIIKLDSETKKPLKGAELVLKDSEGKEIARWTSGENEQIVDKLVIGNSYTLEETKVPDGYKIAQPITFIVEDNGEEIQKIQMDDVPDVPTGISSHYMLYGSLIILACGAIYIIKRKYN